MIHQVSDNGFKRCLRSLVLTKKLFWHLVTHPTEEKYKEIELHAERRDWKSITFTQSSAT